jgi:hypothetical protein
VADLTNRSVASSYKELLKTASEYGFTEVLTVVEDGDATASSLQLANNAAKFTGVLSVDGATTINNVEDSISRTTGSLIVKGGVGIEKTLNVGGNLNVDGNAVIQGTLTANGGTLTLGNADTDNVVFQADVNSDIRPNVNGAYSLGVSGLQWRDLYIDGTAFIDNLQIRDTAQINPQGAVVISPTTGAGILTVNPAGISSMDNVVVGAGTPRNGTFLNLTALTGQVISATTSSVDKDTGALVVNGGVGIEENLNVGGNFRLDGNSVVSGDSAVNGGDITTTNSTFNLINTNATTLNIGGAAVSLSVGAPTGTTTINHSLSVAGGVGQTLTVTDGSLTKFSVDSINGNVVTSGDVAVNGGDITTNQTTFNLINANATTLNIGAAATALNVGASTGTLTIANPTITATNAAVLSLNGANPAIQTTQTGTASVFNTNASTGALFGAATSISIGANTGSLTVANPTITGSNATTLNLNGANPSIVTTQTGTASVFNTNALTGSLFGAATSISIGASTGTTTVNHSLTVAGGVGQSFVVNDGAVNRFTIDSTNGNTLVAGTLGVTGTSTLSSTLAVTGATTLSSTLAVTGDSTLTGNLAVNGGNLTTTAATFNILNATATTVNAFGAGTAINLGAATGITTIKNNAQINGTLGVNGASTLSSTLGVADTLTITKATGTGLAVTASATVGGDLTVSGNLTVNGTTTNINTVNLVVEDKNVILGDVASPTDVTADGGGITLKGTTDKTLNWIDSTDSWTSSEHMELASGKNYRINGNSVLSGNTLGSGVTGSSLTQTGTVTSGTWSSTVLTNDDVFTIRDSVDNTKRFQFQASGITTGQTRTLTVTDANQTLVGFTGTSTDTWTWDTDFDHITVVIPSVGTRKIPYYA